MERPRRILVVDDQQANRELLEALLTQFGHEVDLAANGAEALEKLGASHDLVMLDVMMAGMDGYEVARKIRGETAFAEIPICMVTALSGKAERLRAVEAGANDFIDKPIDRTELRVRTSALLKVKEAQEAIRVRAAQEAENRCLLANYELLHKLGKLKDDFVGMASHDLKSPLTCILSYASLIKMMSPPGTPEKFSSLQEYGAIIASQCRVMQKIIEDFLDFQALEDGRIKLHPESFDFNELAVAVIEHNKAYAAEKKISLSLNADCNPLPVRADRHRLDQVLNNYLSNAVKFSPRGRPVSIDTHKSGKGIFVEVRDSGPGLSADDFTKLFLKYAQLSNLPTGDEKSSGLGLAICKMVLEMQGGTTGARNNPDGGATFWFELPGQSPAAPNSLNIAA